MTIESYVRPEYDLVIFVHTGIVPDEEFLMFYKSFFESDTFKPPMNLLIDLRNTNSSARSTEAIRYSAKSMQENLADITSSTKVAVVAPKDLSFGLARMYEIFSDYVQWNFVVFRCMDAALVWLDLPEDLTIHEST